MPCSKSRLGRQYYADLFQSGVLTVERVFYSPLPLVDRCYINDGALPTCIPTIIQLCSSFHCTPCVCREREDNMIAPHRPVRIYLPPDESVHQAITLLPPPPPDPAYMFISPVESPLPHPSRELSKNYVLLTSPPFQASCCATGVVPSLQTVITRIWDKVPRVKRSGSAFRTSE